MVRKLKITATELDRAMATVDIVRRPTLVRGMCALRSADGAVQFRRLPPALETFYHGAEGSRIRARCTSGVRIHFISNTRRIRLVARYGHAVAWTKKHAFDFEVDGKVVKSFGSPEADPGTVLSDTVFDDLDRRDRDFVIWLPHLCEAQVERMEIETDASLREATLPSGRWLALGDSITQGFVTDGPSETYVALTARKLGLDFVNMGVGGATTEVALGAAAGDVPADIITVALGLNDYVTHRPSAQFEHEVTRLLQSLREIAPHVTIAWITPIPYVGKGGVKNAAGLYLGDYAHIIRRVARLCRTKVIDGFSLLPEEECWFVDNCHPNRAGHALYARNLSDRLKPLLSRSPSRE
jgi:lysophospholipase L1-like esterase